MSDGAVEYDTVRVPPFFAPANSGAGPLAAGSSAAAILPPSEAFGVSPVPASLAGAAHAAVSPIDATTPTARTLVQRMFAPLSPVPTTVGRELPYGSEAR